MAKIRPPKQEAKSSIKTPVSSGLDIMEVDKPFFSLVYLQKSDCLNDCTKDEKAAFADTLKKLSEQTWNEIACSGRHGAGYEKISKHQIKRNIPIHISDDVNLIAFRFFGKAPMIGYRQKNIFFVLWFDRAFTVYKH